MRYLNFSRQVDFNQVQRPTIGEKSTDGSTSAQWGRLVQGQLLKTQGTLGDIRRQTLH